MAGILIAAALLVAPPFARAAIPEIPQSPPINTAAPVDQNQCALCHLDLGSVNKPGLIFSHGNHLMVSCDGCHSRMPHKNGSTESVPMEVCFACHGVQHGPQGELATSECGKCHPKNFKLTPASHDATDYAKAPHADESKKLGTNSCMMCHLASKDCNPCHEKQNVQIAPLPDTYVNILYPRPKPASVKIYPDGPTTMAQCVYCHPDLDAFTPGELVFAHAPHIQRNYKCTVCHPTFGHDPAGPIKPTMLSCYRCHGVEHSTQGLIAGEDCLKCHPKSFNLVPKNHTQSFIKGKHKAAALREPEYCEMCHKSEFCVTCHQGKSTSPNAPDKPVIPSDHRTPKWIPQHGKLYLAGKGQCGVCHDGPSCQRCHLTPVPHPPNWISNHRPPPGIPPSDCNICHTDRTRCQNCHHQKVKQVPLIQRNCARGPGMKGCHVEMMQKPATAIKNKGFAEHAVHFDVAKKKGRPYMCYECHTDFGNSKAAQNVEAVQGHDLRLCYGCHGALDPVTHEQIAPYRGSELCRRCHSNLNF